MTPEEHIRETLMVHYGETLESAPVRLVVQVSVEILSRDIAELQSSTREMLRRLDAIDEIDRAREAGL